MLTALLLFSLSATTGSNTQEVLVLNSAAVALPKTVGRTAISIQNLGPNDIFCSFVQAQAVVNKGHRIAAKPATGPADSWAIDARAAVDIWCIAATADQVTGAATIVDELKEK